VITSTYRLQISPAFTMDAAASLVDYLARLGVGAVYTSPLLTASPGSTHGYDVVDPTQASPELGGEEARQRLVSAARAAGLSLVVDIVPNHMSVEVPTANPWWWDVLAHGPSSRYATYFDVDWSRGPILLPVLGSDELDQLEVRDDRLVYFEHEFPLAPGTSGGTPQAVHKRQHYRLVNWRRGNAELTYRRFFDITSLAGVRVEDPAVFEATHGEVLRWVRAGEVAGLRVDHPDGLADPGAYMRRLRAAAPEAWLVVEKILAVDESLPASWPVDGTTGYDALREICGLFVDPAGEPPVPRSLHDVETECRRMITRTSLVAEMRRIAALANVAPEAVAEIMVAFPVYRSYLPESLDNWAAAVAGAKHANPSLAADIDVVDHAIRKDPRGELATRVQQTSGMVVAKGVEDTAFYRWTRFAALNEVGGAPDRFGVTPSEFHNRAAARAAGWPHTMTALSTHDTKRSEDVRARLAVLSEIPGEWAETVTRWSGSHGIDEPSLNDLAWQSLVGAWPVSADRMRAYLDKAAKEAKIRTSWVDHDEEFEAAVAAWPDRVLADLGGEVEAFAERIAGPGWVNALGQKIVQLAGPGVPDVYQGTDLFDLSLVDPDNRRPVDFAKRQRFLSRLEDGWLPDVDETGAAKLHVVRQVLRLRRDRPDLFTGYRPLAAQGPAAEHAFAFSRAPELVVVATRLPVKLARTGWGDTVLPLPAGAGNWFDLLTGNPVDTGPEPRCAHFGDLLSHYPVALLLRGNR
jgi:(1->4)-alpha-D-glucan 1-alpha-D-glucosylmutase